MWKKKILLIFLLCNLKKCFSNENNDEATQAEAKISDQILAILEHYQNPDPIGLPGAPVPDPMDVPPMKQSFSVATMNFKDMNVYGLSNFKIQYIKTDLTAMEVRVALRIDGLQTNGSYTMSTWLSRSAGPFTVIIKGVSMTGVANLGVERGGRLSVQDINMDVTFDKIDMNFENLGFMGSLFQGIINSVGTFLFDSIKPFILNQANTNIRSDVNAQIANIPYTFPNSISPFDMAIAEARKVVRECGFDPYKMDDYNHTAGIFDIHLTHTWLNGLSNFYRAGDVIIEVNNGTIQTVVDVGTQKIEGISHWEVGVISGMFSRAGTFSFSVDSFKVKVALNQSVDTRKNPIIDDIQLELGNIQVRCDGAGTLDYAIELFINVVPNLLRYQIMDALEGPLKDRIQSDLNKINLKKIAKENLHMLDDSKNREFKPCEFLSRECKELHCKAVLGKDEFFNFIQPENVLNAMKV